MIEIIDIIESSTNEQNAQWVQELMLQIMSLSGGMKLTGQQVVDVVKGYNESLKDRIDKGPRAFDQSPAVIAQSVTTLESLLYRIKVANEEAEKNEEDKK